MKSENRRTKLGVSSAVILVCSLIGAYFYVSNDGGSNLFGNGGRTLLLVSPVFAQSVSSDTTFLEEEAGMTTYVDIGQSIDLAVAKTVYRTIEDETSNYTVGSIALPGLPESEDVHCFVHKNGWIVAYYLKAESMSKIVDWNYWSGGQLTKNKLQVGLEQMGNALGTSVTGAKYYHFQYPSANKCMLIIDTLVGWGEDSFNITIPLEFAVYERSWSHHSEYSNSPTGPSDLKIDGNGISTITATSTQTKCGQLSVSQLSPTVTHSISISGHYSARLYGVCIALVFQEP